MKVYSKLIQWIRHHKILAVLSATLLVVGAGKAAELLTPAKEIALIIGEPWKDMQARSSAKIADNIPNEIWYRVPEELAYLRFADPKFGFTTPPAKFFTVSFDDDASIRSVRMSPQVEPLPLQEALDIVLDLQNQWGKSGWEVMYPDENPPYENSASLIEKMTRCAPDSTYWEVKGKYQIMLIMSCYKDERYPDEQRFLISLSMGKPWH
ncbi:hypothetical protein [uncultured Limnobacter sp.]|uniref:hypothetical protein n=1 Tax=uncultured Limnobacter sp. TaxID=199681 RepID=UPI0030F7DAC5